MVSIRDYIQISNSASSIKNIFTNSQDFREQYDQVNFNERTSFLRFFIINNTPFAFREIPILYEQLTQYLADKLQISPIEIRLIGSSKTGFSMSPPPNYGKVFGTHSDLDFSIVNQGIFDKVQSEYFLWAEKYTRKLLVPKNKKEEFFWTENLTTGANQIKRGFIDTNKIPNYYSFECNQKINNCLYLITKNLNQVHSIVLKKASARVYKNWASFSSTLKFNTECILNKLDLNFNQQT